MSLKKQLKKVKSRQFKKSSVENKFDNFFCGLDSDVTSKDHSTFRRFLNTSDMETVKYENRSSTNTIKVAKTFTLPSDFAADQLQENMSTAIGKHPSTSLSNSFQNSVKKRHVAEILKQSHKMDQVPETLAKLKETILKQKENR